MLMRPSLGDGSQAAKGRVNMEWLPGKALLLSVYPPSPGIPSRHHERPVTETWMASLGCETMEWWTQMTSMMCTAMLRT